jgi:hypothetical protein
MAKAISSSLIDVIRVAPLAPMGGQKINIDHRLSSVYHGHCATRKIVTTTSLSLSPAMIDLLGKLQAKK